MKTILFFIVLWSTTPMEVEKRDMKEFYSMIECKQTQALLIKESKTSSLIIVNEKGTKGLVIGTFCEKKQGIETF